MRIHSSKMSPTGARPEDEALAAAGLSFLAADEDRLGLFLALTGLAPETVRAAARTPGFLAAVLDHIAGDDALSRAFSIETKRKPEAILAARDRLSGRDREWVDP